MAEVQQAPASAAINEPSSATQTKSGGRSVTTGAVKKERHVLTYRESFSQWLKAPSHEEAERNVLSLLDFFPESDGKRVAKVNKVDIGNKLHINEFEIVNVEKPDDVTEAGSEYSKNLVVLHGYGAGLALFYRNFAEWSSIKGSRTMALDLLGFGRSSRPKFSIATKDVSARDENGRFKVVVETENWFIDALEKWRIAKNLDKFTLMGHSMGGYLAAAYAFKYPSRVERLIMVSPAGVERGYTPELDNVRLFGGNSTDSLPKQSAKNKPSSSRQSSDAPHIDEEVSVSQSDITHHHHNELHPSDSHSSLVNEASTSNRKLPNWFMYLWNRNISPFVLLRSAAIFAPRMTSNWTSRRFSDVSEKERDIMHMYAYKTFTAPGSGEYGLTRLLAAGAVAREPLVDRVVKGLKCPSVWIYGENDWMNVHAGEEAVLRLNKLGTSSAANAKSHVIDYAGHHVYLDNPSDFDRVVVDFLKTTNH
ncbi:Cld1p [Sugiyamaella lignohabitans]|uniref:Cld1p n=1 Tax=Sugiyamaella lignohabitans TaxID=796027 RepID=A0A167EYW5_9ASCO|nr:Cld1p [Sugiyamaella lignohabitans]ANB14622.1 Cld1p [Sugiyamaella lignohabitans]